MFSSLRCRTKLLLITVLPLVVITALITLLYYWNGMQTLDQELKQYRKELVEIRKSELKSHVMMG